MLVNLFCTFRCKDQKREKVNTKDLRISVTKSLCDWLIASNK